MKLNELPNIAQEAACEVMKTMLNKTLDKEPALELAHTINAAFTELYFPSSDKQAKSSHLIDTIARMENKRLELIASLYPKGSGRAGESCSLSHTDSNPHHSSDQQGGGLSTQAGRELYFVVLHSVPKEEQ